MIRSVYVILVVLTCSCLFACGGGGGGGASGGKTALVDVPWNPPSAPLNAGTGLAVTNITDVTPVGTQTFTGLSPFEAGGYYITKSADGFVLTSAGGASDHSVTLSAAAGDFKDSGAFITAVKETHAKTSVGDGSYRARDIIILGGEKLNLQHSDFGIWDQYVRYVFADGSTLESSKVGLPLYMGDPGKKASFGPGGAVTFTGVTVANIANQTTIAGTASLTVDPLSLGASSAQLNFANFYNFSIPVAVGADGAFVKGAGNITSTNTGNTTGIDMSSGKIDSASSSFKGQFYGPAPANPQEAVGSYQIYTNDQAWQVMNGSFGVKQ